MRVRFSKTGRAVYISHLDLMRTLQRAAARAGISLKHTEGFNPRPKMNILIPLSLGFRSECELCDFALSENVNLADMPDKLNSALPEGVRALAAYPAGRPVRDIAAAEYEMELIYDGGLPVRAPGEITALFSKPLSFIKKTKKGETEADITGFIKKLSVFPRGGALIINTALSAGAESLNPLYLTGAVESYLPEYKPDFLRICRTAFLDKDLKVFE